MRQVAVLIDYRDWQNIEKLLAECQLPKQEESNISKYAGAIELTQDPLEYQQQIRDEWQ